MNKSLVSALCVSAVCVMALIVADDLPHGIEVSGSESTAPEVAKQAAVQTEGSVSGEAVPSLQNAEHGQKYLLRYRFEPGQKLRYLTVQTATMDAAREDNKKSDRSEVEQRRLFTVEKIDDAGVAHIAMQFEFVRMQLQANGGEPVVFRSDMKPDEIPKMFQMTADRLRGSAARYQVLATGESNPAIEKVVKTSANTDSGQKSEAGTFLMPMASDLIAVGDSWKDVQSVSVRVTDKINRKIEILRSFRLESVDGDLAKIKFTSSIISPIHSPSIRAQLIQSTPRGTLTFDIAQGAMVRKDLRFDQTVINGAGENTVVSSYGTYTEELLGLDSESTVNVNDATATN